MAADDESGSGKSAGGVCNRRDRTTSLQQQQDHRAGVGRKGWSRAADGGLDGALKTACAGRAIRL